MKGGNLKLIFLILFIIAAILGIMVFADVIKIGRSKDDSGSLGRVTIWGTLDSRSVNLVLRDLNKEYDQVSVSYSQKNRDTFKIDLLEAMAAGRGPDMFLVTEDLLFEYDDKIYPIPYSNFPPSMIKTNFVEAGEIFVTSRGILALPIAVDPLVMYYNRNILNNEGIIYPPTDWEEFASLVPKITEKNENNQISRSTVAMGQFSNVDHAKDIISALFMQIGKKIVKEEGGKFATDFGIGTGFGAKSDLSSALAFYLSFTDPLNSNYSWNKSLPRSGEFFSAEKSAFYFGFASEYKNLQRKNPNHNFFVTSIPQLKDTQVKATYAHILGVSISLTGKNKNGALFVAPLLANTSYAERIASAENMVPARRDLLMKPNSDPYMSSFYSSALYAKSWLDPNDAESNKIFSYMVENVLSNTLTVTKSISAANSRMENLLR